MMLGRLAVFVLSFIAAEDFEKVGRGFCTSLSGQALETEKFKTQEYMFSREPCRNYCEKDLTCTGFTEDLYGEWCELYKNYQMIGNQARCPTSDYRDSCLATRTCYRVRHASCNGYTYPPSGVRPCNPLSEEPGCGANMVCENQCRIRDYCFCDRTTRRESCTGGCLPSCVDVSPTDESRGKTPRFTDSCDAQPNVNFHFSRGALIRGPLRQTKTAIECQILCEYHEECRFWKWHVAELMRYQCVLAKSKRRATTQDHVTSGGPCSDPYNDLGMGKCVLSNGTGANFDFFGPVGLLRNRPHCEELCNEEQQCGGYSWSDQRACLLYLAPRSNLKLDSADQWGNSHCMVKPEYCTATSSQCATLCRGNFKMNTDVGRRNNIGNRWNDKVKAVWVKENCELEIYEDADYKGSMEKFGAGAHYSGNILHNRSLTSYKCTCVEEDISLPAGAVLTQLGSGTCLYNDKTLDASNVSAFKGLAPTRGINYHYCVQKCVQNGRCIGFQYADISQICQVWIWTGEAEELKLITGTSNDDDGSRNNCYAFVVPKLATWESWMEEEENKYEFLGRGQCMGVKGTTLEYTRTNPKTDFLGIPYSCHHSCDEITSCTAYMEGSVTSYVCISVLNFQEVAGLTSCRSSFPAANPGKVCADHVNEWCFRLRIPHA